MTIHGDQLVELIDNDNVGRITPLHCHIDVVAVPGKEDISTTAGRDLFQVGGGINPRHLVRHCLQH